MPDVIELPPPAVDQSGNLTIFWVSTIADVNAPKVAEIKAGKRITYSFTENGWQPSGDQETVKDPRLTLPQDLESFGKKTKGLTVQYVDSTEANSASVILVEGEAGYFVERRLAPNPTDVAAGQKVRVWPVVLGEQAPDQPTGTGKFTTTQKTALSGVVGKPVAVVA
jgi:hypothetical protein